MLVSYMLSPTIFPTLPMYILSAEDEYVAEEHLGEKQGFFRRYQQRFERNFEKLRAGYRRALRSALEHRGIFSSCFLRFCALSAGLVFVLGTPLFPHGDPRQVRVH